MLTIAPPKDAANANVKPYSVPWPKGEDGSLLFGETIVLALVNTAGAVENIKVESTSGVPALDMAAVEGVRRWHFTPGQRNGIPVEGYVRVPVVMNAGGRGTIQQSWESTTIKLPATQAPWGQLPPSKPVDSSQ